MAFCPVCGRPVSTGATFCTACGANVQVAAVGDLPIGRPPQRPPGVTIIGFVLLIGAVALALAIVAIVFWLLAGGVFASAFLNVFPWMGMFAPFGAIATLFAVFAMILLLALGVLTVATGIGVLQGKSWAWAATLVLMGLSGLNALSQVVGGDFGGLLGLAVAGIVIWYFLRPEVRAWFARV